MAAAEDTKNPELKGVFQNHARDCASGASELQDLATRLGGRPAKGDTVIGVVHRGWLNLKAAVADHTGTSILDECERGEDVAKKHYADALKEPLPDNIRAVVQKQYDGLLRNHSQIRDLRNRFRAATP